MTMLAVWTPDAWSASKRLTVGGGAFANSMDPHSNTTGEALATYNALYDALTYIDAKGEIKPALATEWKVISPTVTEFKLRQGVQFHNGDPFTADDVKFSIERVLDPANRLAVIARIPTIKGVTVVDPRTARIETKAPDPILLRRLAAIFILPSKYFASVGDRGFGDKPVGTGAFQLKSFTKGHLISLEAAKNSWRGKPHLQEVVMRIMPEAAVRVSALKTGEIDMVRAVPLDQAEALKAEGFDIRVAVLARMDTFNLNAVRDTPLRDKRVRQALNYAVDKETMLKQINKGFGRLSDCQLLGPDGFGYNPKLKPYPYDPAKAKQLLAAAGHPNGFEIKMTGSQGFFPNDKQHIEAFIGYLRAVGVRVDLQVVETSVWVQSRIAGTIRDIFFQGKNYFPVMDADFGYANYESTFSGVTYNNPRFDQLFQASRQELDERKRGEIIHAMAELMCDDPPVVFMFQEPDAFAINKAVKGFEPRKDLVIWFDTITKD